MVTDSVEYPALVRPDDVIEEMDISKRKFWQLVEAGEIPVVRFGKRIVRVPGSFLQGLRDGRIAS